MDVKVSVILPVYNVEKYLWECLDSLLNQTLKEIEIICVDDGSTDKSLDILKEYQKHDDRIVVLTQKNLYAGTARNSGLKIAKGEYVLFLDSDDFFENDLLESVYNKGKDKDADIVLFGASKYETNCGAIIETPWYFDVKKVKNKEVFSRKDFPNKILTITSPAPWTKAYKREFILSEALEYQPLPNSNDVFFSLVAMAVAKRITWINKSFVFYRVGMSNNIQSRKTKNPCCFLQAYRAVYDELNKRGIYEEIEYSFKNVVFSGINFNLETIKSQAALREVYKCLVGPIFKDMNLMQNEGKKIKKKLYSVVESAICIGEEILADEKRDNICKDYDIIRESKYHDKCSVSVIIPIYNVEDYLVPCLDSIVKQTFEDIEIICIIDGSPDNSMEIVKQYAAKDDRIKIIDQKNAGLSASRNHGFYEAKGEYVYFMDSDDILELDACEKLYSQAKEYDLDVVFFDAVCFSDTDPQASNNRYYLRNNSYPQCAEGIEMFMNLQCNREFRASACLQFTRRQHLEDISLEFHEGVVHEDNAFSLLNMISSAKVGYSPNAFFHRRYRDNSITTVSEAFKNSYGYFVAMKDVLSRDDLYSHFTIDQLTYVYNEVNTYIRSARNIFSRLKSSEKNAYKALKFNEQKEYEMLIAQPGYMIEKMTIRDEKINRLGKQLRWRRKLKNIVKKILPKKVIKLIRKTLRH